MNKIKLYYGTSRLYSNRIVKADLSNDKVITLDKEVNFIQGDGINTILNCNLPSEQMQELSNLSPSYLIVDDTQYWYVISCSKQRQGQITLTLRRDFLSEYWESLKKAPFVCTKSSTLPSSLEIAKYQKTTNLSQVKTAEYLIKDNPTSQGYIVGYVAKAPQKTGEETDENYFFSFTDDGYQLDSNNQNTYQIEVAGISNWKYYQKKLFFLSSDINVPILMQQKDNSRLFDRFLANLNNYSNGYQSALPAYKDKDGTVRGFTIAYRSKWYDEFKTALKATLKYALENVFSLSGYEEIEEDKIGELDGKIIYDSTNKEYYIIHTNKYTYKLLYEDGDKNLGKYFHEQFNAFPGSVDIIAGNSYYTTYSISLELLDDAEEITNIAYSSQDYVKCLDTPYDIFVLPVAGTFTDENGAFTIHKDTVFNMVKKIQSTLTNSVLYDIQWLPYIPYQLPSSIANEGGTKRQFYPIRKDNQTLAFMAWLPSSQGQIYLQSPLNINVLLPNTQQLVGGLDIPNDPLGQRIYNEENYFRIVSPNYSSQFDFYPVKNQGLKNFYVDIALKPYTPYIYLSPDYRYLYGNNFKDGRGLILSGDYSLDQVNDQWQNYKLNNKNYELIFNRQVQSLELRNTYQNRLDDQQLLSDVFSAAAGTSEAASTGFIAGGVAGAIVGGISSAAAGAADIAFNATNRRMARAIRDDTKQAMVDNYQYRLGNIKALPATLTKLSAMNPDFKIFPLIEYYTCTGQEDENLRESIKYNGIDINLKCELQDFDKGYIEGSILQFPSDLNISDDQARAINSELQCGIYYKEV